MKNLSPKTYIGNENMSEKAYLKAGFYSKPNTYDMSFYIYKDIVKAAISIDKEDFEMSVDVTHNGNMFAPFYNPDDRYNNVVYEKSTTEYNKQMDALVKNGVLICESD